MELSIIHNENESLGETLSVDIPPLSIGTLSEECINCDAISLFAKYGRTEHYCCQYGKVELASVNYSKALKKCFSRQSVPHHVNILGGWRVPPSRGRKLPSNNILIYYNNYSLSNVKEGIISEN